MAGTGAKNRVHLRFFMTDTFEHVSVGLSHCFFFCEEKDTGPVISRGLCGFYGRAHQRENAISPHGNVPQTSLRTVLELFLW